MDFWSYSLCFYFAKRNINTEVERSQQRAELYHALLPVLKWANTNGKRFSLHTQCRVMAHLGSGNNWQCFRKGECYLACKETLLTVSSWLINPLRQPSQWHYKCRLPVGAVVNQRANHPRLARLPSVCCKPCLVFR